MSTKAKSKATASKSKPSAKKSAPAKAAATLSKKGPASAKSSAKMAAGKGTKGDEAAAIDPNAPVVDLEELEEQEAEAATARASGGSGAEAELAAAAAGTGEMSASFKNFRHHPDMENFYRFIFENDLRHEAVAILDKMQAERLARKSIKLAKGQAH